VLSLQEEQHAAPSVQLHETPRSTPLLQMNVDVRAPASEEHANFDMTLQLQVASATGSDTSYPSALQTPSGPETVLSLQEEQHAAPSVQLHETPRGIPVLQMNVDVRAPVTVEDIALPAEDNMPAAHQVIVADKPADVLVQQNVGARAPVTAEEIALPASEDNMPASHQEIDEGEGVLDDHDRDDHHQGNSNDSEDEDASQISFEELSLAELLTSIDEDNAAADLAEEEAFARRYFELRAAQQPRTSGTNDDHTMGSNSNGRGNSMQQPKQETLAADTRRRGVRPPGAQTQGARLPSNTSVHPGASRPAMRNRAGSGRARTRLSAPRSHSTHRSVKHSTADTVSALVPVLPAMRRNQSAPGWLREPGESEVSNIDELQAQLSQEIASHQETFERMKELERKLRNSSRTKKQFGVTNPAPYASPPVAVQNSCSPKRRGVALPPLRCASAPKREQDNNAAAAAIEARAALNPVRMAALSRSDKSRCRVEAISLLQKQGLNTWHARRAEKVSKFQDLAMFGESMWDSFFEWQEDLAHS